MDSLIECPRCGSFHICHRAEVNLNNIGPAPNADFLSGYIRHIWERHNVSALPRIIWQEFEGNRDGRYMIEGLPTTTISPGEKPQRLLQFLAFKTDSSAGEIVILSLPDDISLGFAKSMDEFKAILEHLREANLIKIHTGSKTTIKPIQLRVSLTLNGADTVFRNDSSNSVSGTTTGGVENAVQQIDLEITGPKKKSGGFGTVYPGFQAKLNRVVAIKIIHPNAMPDAISHARALASVNHRNVVTVYCVGKVVDPTSKALVDCVVMEWIEGKDLWEIWKGLNRDHSVRISKSIIAGVRAIHDAGICHHDIHAGNVLVNENDVKIIDLHYTESARFSRVSTLEREKLIGEDWYATGGMIRQLFWHTESPALDSDIERALVSATTQEEIENAVSKFENASISVETENKTNPTKIEVEGLTELDITVFRLAGDQVVCDDRLRRIFLVPNIVEACGNLSGVVQSIRFLSEMAYFEELPNDNPRWARMSHFGFSQYLKIFRPTFITEYQRVCVAIVRDGYMKDYEIATITEIVRPVVEQVIYDLTTQRLIESSQFNSELEVHEISEKLRRIVQNGGAQARPFTNNSTGLEQSTDVVFTSTERTIIMEVGKCSNGTINCSESDDGSYFVQTNGKELNHENTPRSKVRWKSAITSLFQRRILEKRGDNGRFFALTGKGYKIFDRLVGEE